MSIRAFIGVYWLYNTQPLPLQPVTIRTKMLPLVRRTSLLFIHFLGSLLGYAYYYSRAENYRVSWINLRLIFPQMSPVELRALIRASLIHSGKLALEVLFFWLVPGDLFVNSIRKIHGEQYLQQARAEGKAVIFICPHLGNWEIFNMYAGRFACHSTYKPLLHKWLDERIRHCRQKHGSTLVPLTTRGIRKIVEVIKNAGVIFLAPDQLPDGQGRVEVPYFGVKARSGTLFSRLMQKHPHTSVICAYAERLPNAAGYEIHLVPALPEVYAEDPLLTTTALNQSMEQCIRRCKDQYLWEYKRFKYTVSEDLYKQKQAF